MVAVRWLLAAHLCLSVSMHTTECLVLTGIDASVTTVLLARSLWLCWCLHVCAVSKALEQLDAASADAALARERAVQLEQELVRSQAAQTAVKEQGER